MKRSMTSIIVVGLATVLALGCAHSLDKAAKPRPKPEWAVRGPGAFKSKDSALIYGLGIASAMPNASLQRKSADLRARESVAAVLKSSVQSLTKDFQEHHADYFKPEGKATSEEVINYTAKGVVDAELANCKILDYWEDPNSGELYSLAKFDLNDGFYGSFKDNLTRALRENGPTKNIIDTDKEMTAFDKELQKQRFDAVTLLGISQTAAPIEPMADPE